MMTTTHFGLGITPSADVDVRQALITGLEEEFKSRRCKCKTTEPREQLSTFPYTADLAHHILTVYRHHDRDYVKITAKDDHILVTTCGRKGIDFTITEYDLVEFEYADPDSIDRVISHTIGILK